MMNDIFLNRWNNISSLRTHIHLASSTDFIQITTGFQKTAKLLLAKGFKKIRILLDGMWQKKLLTIKESISN